jgi:hypothetical protein
MTAVNGIDVHGICIKPGIAVSECSGEGFVEVIRFPFSLKLVFKFVYDTKDGVEIWSRA